jgi:hypothetical protein
MPGPGPNALTLINFQNRAWDIRFTVLTTQPLVAPKLALPRPGFSLPASRAGPLLQSVDSCSKLQVGAVHEVCVLEQLWLTTQVAECQQPRCPLCSSIVSLPSSMLVCRACFSAGISVGPVHNNAVGA